MRCPECSGENADLNRFCVFCGTPLTSPPAAACGPAPPPMRPPARGQAVGIEQRVELLEGEIERMRQTLVQHGLAVAPARRLMPGQARPSSGARAASEAAETPAASAAGQLAGLAATPSAEAVEAAPAFARGARRRGPGMPWEGVDVDWEAVIGGNWLARIGVLAIVVGMAFFLKLAFDNDWIGETGRVVLGLLGGLTMLGAGEYLARRYAVYANALTGGGVALLYLATFAAFAIYGLIDFYPATAFLLLISITGAALALRYESMPLAVIGLAGAYAGPFLLGGFGANGSAPSGEGQGGQLVGYIIGVNVGVLALSMFRNWRWFTLLGLGASLITFGMWLAEAAGPDDLLIAEAGLTVIFLQYVGATTLYHIIWRRRPKAFDLTLMLVNASAYFGISCGLMWTELRDWMGGFTLLLALFYGGVAYGVVSTSGRNAYLSLMSVGIALIFLTIAVPVQLAGPWVSVAWAVEGAVLIWLSYNLRAWQLRTAALALFAAFAVWVIAVNLPDALERDLIPFLNVHLPVFIVTAGATYVAAYLTYRHRDQLRAHEKYLFPVFLTGANALIAIGVPTQVDGAWMTLAWALEAVALTWLAFRLGLREMLFFGIGLFLLAGLSAVVGSSVVESRGYTVVINERMLAFLPAIAGLYVAAVMVYLHRKDDFGLDMRRLLIAAVIAANGLTLWVLSAEVIGAIQSGAIAVPVGQRDSVTGLSLTVLWAAYASLALAVGIVKGWRGVRIGGLGLLAVPIVKLFLVDSFALEQGYRVAAFLTLGAIMLAGGFVYQRFSAEIRGFLFEKEGVPDET